MIGQRDLAPLPDDLESPCGKLVYLYLSAAGGATVSELEERLDLPGLTLYSVLSTLSDRGLVDRDDDEEAYYPVTGENSPVMSQEWRQ